MNASTLRLSRAARLRGALPCLAIMGLLAVGVAALPGAAHAQYKAASNAILKIGNKLPTLSGTDQFGKPRTFDNLKGPNGLVILFFRSADWCPYCKGQLLSLQRAAARFKAKGLGLAGVSYDSVDILKFFTDKYSISYPLLSDPNSETIERFGVLNKEATGFRKGMAFPGFVYANATGRIQETFFEEDYHTRFTGGSMLLKIFPELASSAPRDVPAPHIQLKLAQSDDVASPGNRVTLIADLSLPPDLHVYAPGVDGYRPIALQLDATPRATPEPAVYPKPKILLLPAIHEKVPVYEGNFRITQDVTIAFDDDFAKLLAAGPPSGSLLKLDGLLLYQACDSHVCYPPEKVPVSWPVTVLPPNTVRAPDEIQHK